MEDNILPPYYGLLTQLLPDHLARNERIAKLLTTAHDDMLDGHEARMLLNIYRRFMELLLSDNPDPLLTERVRDAFVQAVTDVGATLGTQNARGLASTDGQTKAEGRVKVAEQLQSDDQAKVKSRLVAN